MENRKPIIRVIDSIMGSGKTTAVIGEINRRPRDKYICIVKYLDEVDRIITQCPDAKFRQPGRDFVTKQEHFHELLNEGRNIVITHALFGLLEITPEEVKRISDLNYHLIIDETVDVIDVLNISDDDRKLLLKDYISIDEETSLVKWREDQATYEGLLDTVKQQINTRSVVLYANQFFLWLLSIDLLKAFNKITVMTFLFNGSLMKYYLDLYKFGYRTCHVQVINGTYTVVEGKENLSERLATIRPLIDIYYGHMNEIGEKETALSHTWHTKPGNKSKVSDLEKNAINYLQNMMNAKASNAQWTTFKTAKATPRKLRRYAKAEDEVPALCGRYLKGAFVSCNSLATNKHKDRCYLAYLVNIYQNPLIDKWFNAKGINVDQDAIALSQMIQWVWRSAIRDGWQIWIYIPSVRMRRLLNHFLSTGEVYHRDVVKKES